MSASFVYDFPVYGLMADRGARAFLLEGEYGEGVLRGSPIFTDRDLLDTFCQRFPMPAGTWMTTLDDTPALRAHVYAGVSGPTGWVVVDPTVTPDGTVNGSWMLAGTFVERPGAAV